MPGKRLYLPKERPILMSDPMVLALLDKRKTQTRRTIKPQPDPDMKWSGWILDSTASKDTGKAHWHTGEIPHITNTLAIRCPYGKPGDLLWVREAWRTGEKLDEFNAGEIAVKANDVGYMRGPYGPIWYPADDAYRRWGDCDRLDFGAPGRLRHARFMPRWASRILLRITEIRVERLQDISREDAIAEGIVRLDGFGPKGDSEAWGIPGMVAAINPVLAYHTLWESINGVGSWNKNPWAWVIGFELVEAGR